MGSSACLRQGELRAEAPDSTGAPAGPQSPRARSVGRTEGSHPGEKPPGCRGGPAEGHSGPTYCSASCALLLWEQMAGRSSPQRAQGHRVCPVGQGHSEHAGRVCHMPSPPHPTAKGTLNVTISQLPGRGGLCPVVQESRVPSCPQTHRDTHKDMETHTYRHTQTRHTQTHTLLVKDTKGLPGTMV